MVILRPFTKKLFRDIKSSKWQFAAVVLLLVIGMIFFTGLSSAFQNLWKSVDEPYQKLNFADFTIKIYSAPSNVTQQIQSMSGVKAAVGRINVELPLTMPSMENQFLTGRIISLPRVGHATVNDVQVEKGEYFTLNSENEALIEKAFAEYHDVNVGDQLTIISGNTQYNLLVKGIVVSPEYMWPSRNIQDHMPTVLRTWGVIFLPQDEANRILNANGTINEIAVTTNSQSTREETTTNVRTALEPYGIAEVVPRDNQASDKLIRVLVGSLGMLGPILAGFFLIVAAMTTYVLLTRMVNSQHIQIGTLRALGYKKQSILFYYVGFALIVWLSSTIIGVIVGQVASIYLTNLFASRISLPLVIIEFQLPIFILGSLLALGFLMGATILPAYSAANLNPAAAMRPKAPKLGKIVKMNFIPFFRHASSSWKMPLRNLSRSKKRSVATILGIMLATSLVVATTSFLDSFDNVFNVMYKDVAVYDLKVSFIKPQPLSIVQASENLTGVREAEAIVQVPYHIENNDKEYSVVIMGLNDNSTLYKLYDSAGHLTKVDQSGILLSTLLKDKLKVNINDSLTLHFFNSSMNVTVAGFVDTPFGQLAFLSMKKAQSIMGIDDEITALLVKADPNAQDTVKQDLFKLPSVSGIESINQQKQDNVEMLKLFNTFIWLIFAFGILMAFAVVFNTVSLNILERSREFATMRTIGVQMHKIALMSLFENFALGVLGVALGLPFGNYLATFFLSFYASDIFVINAVTYNSTYILAIAVIFLVLVISSLPGLRYVKHLNLAKVVKEQLN